MKKFHDKTKNDWHDRANFTKYNGKYDFVEQDFGANVKEEIKEEIDEDVKIEPCTLADEIQELIKMICDVRMMESFAKEMKFDIERAPLGKLTEKQIKNGIKILKNIEDAVLKSSNSTLSKLTSQFYTRIPHDFGMTRPPVINSLDAVKEEYELLESLRQITIAINVKESGGAHIDPTTKAFNNLNSVIQVKTGQEFNFVQTLLTETHGPTHSAYSLKLESLFLVEREGEKERYNTKVGNDTLLWHGSRTTNFAGIIKNGLRIAPPEAPVTGYMFGKDRIHEIAVLLNFENHLDLNWET
jgi:poly [ADP-ribose] polymerase